MEGLPHSRSHFSPDSACQHPVSSLMYSTFTGNLTNVPAIRVPTGAADLSSRPVAYLLACRPRGPSAGEPPSGGPAVCRWADLIFKSAFQKNACRPLNLARGRVPVNEQPHSAQVPSLGTLLAALSSTMYMQRAWLARLACDGPGELDRLLAAAARRPACGWVWVWGCGRGCVCGGVCVCVSARARAWVRVSVSSFASADACVRA